MPVSADCLNTQSFLGQNFTPLPLIISAEKVMGGINTDIASSPEENAEIRANNYYDFHRDGYLELTQNNTYLGKVWMNPPGHSYTGGTLAEREALYPMLGEGDKWKVQDYIKKCNAKKDALGRKIKKISSAHWYRAIFDAWDCGFIEEAVVMVYRAGSLGSLPEEFLNTAMVCLTCAGVKSRTVSRSGRISFEQKDEEGRRVPGVANTQSSAILYLPPRYDGVEKMQAFRDEFGQYGAILQSERSSNLLSWVYRRPSQKSPI
jgi:hypothetical protein